MPKHLTSKFAKRIELAKQQFVEITGEENAYLFEECDLDKCLGKMFDSVWKAYCSLHDHSGLTKDQMDGLNEKFNKTFLFDTLTILVPRMLYGISPAEYQTLQAASIEASKEWVFSHFSIEDIQKRKGH